MWAVLIPRVSVWAENSTKDTRAKIRIDPGPAGGGFGPPNGRNYIFGYNSLTLGRPLADFGQLWALLGLRVNWANWINCVNFVNSGGRGREN